MGEVVAGEVQSQLIDILAGEDGRFYVAQADNDDPENLLRALWDNGLDDAVIVDMSFDPEGFTNYVLEIDNEA